MLAGLGDTALSVRCEEEQPGRYYCVAELEGGGVWEGWVAAGAWIDDDAID
ncbi:MAG TPA: hypothetical protein VK501_10850 [Baekduia sp.]|uniref:hypothetical protein n=1 Tax=Baekduia sp. TaxID=2600305 RepID=UPI002C017ACE|nr:hypothetical protein [Baekduia sp.]HMJ34404.1 hypothetical protein [Baekduia sp.]